MLFINLQTVKWLQVVLFSYNNNIMYTVKQFRFILIDLFAPS